MDPISANVLRGIMRDNMDLKPQKNEKQQITAISQTLQAMKDYKFHIKQERLRKVLEARKARKN